MDLVWMGQLLASSTITTTIGNTIKHFQLPSQKGSYHLAMMRGSTFHANGDVVTSVASYKCLRQASMTRKRWAELTGPATNQRPCESCGAATCVAFGCYEIFSTVLTLASNTCSDTKIAFIHVCIDCIQQCELQRASASKNSNMQDSVLLGIFATLLPRKFWPSQGGAKIDKQDKTFEQIVIVDDAFQNLSSNALPHICLLAPHLQSLVQPVDSICHALCKWRQGTCHLATGQSGYVCKHPVLRPWVQITSYCVGPLTPPGRSGGHCTDMATCGRNSNGLTALFHVPAKCGSCFVLPWRQGNCTKSPKSPKSI